MLLQWGVVQWMLPTASVGNEEQSSIACSTTTQLLAVYYRCHSLAETRPHCDSDQIEYTHAALSFFHSIGSAAEATTVA